MPEIFRQFTRFTGVGFMSAIGHYGLFGLLTHVFGVAAVPASSAGALLGAWINYTLNYRFTFRSNKRHLDSVSKFAVVATVGLVLNTFFMWIGVDLLHVNKWLAQILTTGLCLIWSFGANRYWTFRVQQPK